MLNRFYNIYRYTWSIWSRKTYFLFSHLCFFKMVIISVFYRLKALSKISVFTFFPSGALGAALRKQYFYRFFLGALGAQ